MVNFHEPWEDRLMQDEDPDKVPPETPGSGENVCRKCAGSGELDGHTCPDCDGTGKVTTGIGGG
jgi:RecJ-like exonuclease